MGERTIELVRFRLRAGVDETTFLEAAELANDALYQVRGFVGREIAVDRATGVWTDILYWRDSGAADDASRQLTALPEASSWLALRDPASIVTDRLAKVAEAA